MIQFDGGPPVAVSIHVRGVVQGVGFRPHVYRLAQAHDLAGWVRNGQDGVRIHAEGRAPDLAAFVDALSAEPPPAARIAAIEVEPDVVTTSATFEIRDSDGEGVPATRIAPDLSLCNDCLHELLDPQNRRFQYPYINCTNCGPRFSIVRALPYDRGNTTMAGWGMCDGCRAEYENPLDRRFHAQPVACASCGPRYQLIRPGEEPGVGSGETAIQEAARRLREGQILAVKGIGGYHLACDADSAPAVAALRERKFRKDKPFAVMTRDLETAERTVVLSADDRSLLQSPASPIVLAPARSLLPYVAPGNHDIGVMLPYSPLHHLLFAAGAPVRLVMTSGNRSSEPIAYTDEEALRRLDGLADAFLAGERPIARRMDDSIVRTGPAGPMVLRRSRGLAPGAVASIPASGPVLALGGDLKNTVTLVVGGDAYMSQYVGDLSDAGSLRAFEETVRDLLAMYDVAPADLLVVHDAHPQYVSAAHAASVGAARTLAVQHHRAHVASVLAERGEFDRAVIGAAFDGTGYGDDGAIWGGELFAGSVRGGFERVAHLRETQLAGGDAAARFPVQSAAGFLAAIDELAAVDFTASPFCFPRRYLDACAVQRTGIRTFRTTSAGRLFDAVAAVCGFVGGTTFEGQAAMWLEHLARDAGRESFDVPLPCEGPVIDWRPALLWIVHERLRGTRADIIARAFHRALATGVATAIQRAAAAAKADVAVVSGGVVQNVVFLDDLQTALRSSGIDLWTNRAVPPNDGGLSLGQAAMTLQPGPAG